MFVPYRLCFTILFVFSVGLAGTAQPVVEDQDGSFSEIHQAAKNRSGVNPLLQNGIFYENRYMTAEGHPFLLSDAYQTGSLLYRKQHYQGVRIKYDIFTQQVLISYEQDGTVLQNYLSEEFLEAFSIDGKQFKMMAPDGASPLFYQEVYAGEKLSCYYQWYKTRIESHEAGTYKIYVFSEEKRRMYLNLGAGFTRYRNNRSFVRAFPAGIRKQVRSYLKNEGMKVDRADDPDTRELLLSCSGFLKDRYIE